MENVTVNSRFDQVKIVVAGKASIWVSIPQRSG